MKCIGMTTKSTRLPKVRLAALALLFTTLPAAAQPADQTAAGGMRLEQLEQMALANNPTVAQAQANLRVAAGLTRQAGLYPNPTVGYYGDEIRGGYTGGGKQADSSARRFCSGANCAPRAM
jgi:outer membrane protein TolC